MGNTSEAPKLAEREVFYQRARTRNRIFEKLVAFFNQRAEQAGVTKRQIASKLNRDPAQITRWLTQPSNLTLDTLSDLLVAMDAELDVSIHLFADRALVNAVHPWMEEYWEAGQPKRAEWVLDLASNRMTALGATSSSSGANTVVGKFQAVS